MFKDKTLLITGGTGSFGNAVLARFLHTDIKEIRVFSRDEKKQDEMRIKLRNPKLKFYVGDVRDSSSIMDAMAGVNYVFHAAALKQVPSCEFYPMQAIKTNILGTENVMNAAVYHNVERFIALSTDKAVYPINAMGLSKAMMEKLVIAKARVRLPGETIICATRYGNVMASRGSVIPLFINQIKTGQAITITDPQMTRFLMSLDDSVDLVLHAFKHGQQGDIFVQKSPAATLLILAKALNKLFQTRNTIKIIGTRHGEKLFESLVSREEMVKAEESDNYYKVPADNRDLNYGLYYDEGNKNISKANDYTSHNTMRLTLGQTVKLLSKLDYIQKELNTIEGSAYV